ncbi:MAG: methyltransferase domain-containing protein [bacterium]|nr:methyltransferase domain-containing protein [Planctomycetota bacterium]HIL51425.1 methyltransferase domain-containing protein [Planctomycetota bacterium]
MQNPAILTAWVLVAALGSCAAPAPDSFAPDTTEASVRSGLNARFLDEDLDVDELVAIFESESREIAAERAAIVASLELAPGETIADVGAGTGLFMTPLADGVGALGTVLEVDIAPKLLEFMAERARREGREQVEVHLAGERAVGLARDSVDVILVCDTYHHFEYPESTCASLLHALKPGGRLVLVDFERIEGVSREWVLGHVRASKSVFRGELEAAGFVFRDEVEIDGLVENYCLRFIAP